MPQRISRRMFLQTAGLGYGILVASLQSGWANWDAIPKILSRIRPPVFPNHDFDITQYGAVGDGMMDCSQALHKAIDACHKAGGGRVMVPAGNFSTGPIHLKSNVNLHLSEGSVLLFHQDSKRYLPVVYTRWEGVECLNYSPLIYAFEQKNIAITGSGTLDGQADNKHWWPWCGSPFFGGNPETMNQRAARNRLFKMGSTDIHVKQRLFGEGNFLRPNFVQFYRCKNILIEGVTVRNSPMWQLHPVLCTNITVRGVSMISHGPNNDGCNPESCRDVLIDHCLFDTGDDCIAVKSGRNRDGRRIGKPSENIIIRNCQMKDGHGGVTLGSEASGGIRNVFAENCTMDSPHLDRALRLKTNSVRGGFIENIHMRNVTVGQVADAVLHIDMFYEEGDAGKFPPSIRNITLTHVTSRKSKFALYLRGYKNAPLRGIRLSECAFENAAKPDVIENVEGLVMDHVSINGHPFGQ
jgi:polygalacturonase